MNSEKDTKVLPALAGQPSSLDKDMAKVIELLTAISNRLSGVEAELTRIRRNTNPL